jgi:hypothetical protein
MHPGPGTWRASRSIRLSAAELFLVGVDVSVVEETPAGTSPTFELSEPTNHFDGCHRTFAKGELDTSVCFFSGQRDRLVQRHGTALCS